LDRLFSIIWTWLIPIMHPRSTLLGYFRRARLMRDLIVSILASLIVSAPCYAGIPDWWVTRAVIRPEVPDDHFAAINTGQFKHAVTQAVQEMNSKLDGGAGLELNQLIAGWLQEGHSVDPYAMVNAGQLKSVLKLWYDRLNAVHGTTGYPWGGSDNPEVDFEAVNVGQLKKLLRIDVAHPWNHNIAEGVGTLAGETLQAAAGEMENKSGILGAAEHYLRNPHLSIKARGGNPVAIPLNAASIPNAPVATVPGEFIVGQDGSAKYTIRLQGPKGVANVEPALTLDYSSTSGDGPLGIGWSLGGLSVINRGPATREIDGFYDPVDFDDNDRFFLDGERLICVSGIYGQDGSEYRTLKESFSKVLYHKSGGNDWFEVKTKSGLTLEFGHCQTSCIGPFENPGQPCSHPKLTWAVNQVKDSLGNYWQVIYEDMSPGKDPSENTPYLPDYQPVRILYTGGPSRDPFSEFRLVYEDRPDKQRGYMHGFLIRKQKRLKGIEIATEGVVNRSWRLRYNMDSKFQALRGERTMLVSIEEIAGMLEHAGALRLPPTVFAWEEGQRSWDHANEQEQFIDWPTGTPPSSETSNLRLDYRGDPEDDLFEDVWFPKPYQFVDLDGDGFGEILFNHRGVSWRDRDGDFLNHDYRYLLQNQFTQSGHWRVSGLNSEVESKSPRRLLGPHNPFFLGPYPPGYVPQQYHNSSVNITRFPYLTTAGEGPTGAFLVDINGDGLTDMMSSGTFEELTYLWNGSTLVKGSRKVVNASGIWINQGHTSTEQPDLFVKDIDGVNDTDYDHDNMESTPSIPSDQWGEWAFPLVPTEVIPTPGGAIGTRPSDTPAHLQSGEHEVLRLPTFASYKEHDLGWRVVDLDGDGHMDLIRAGQGKNPSGWLPYDSSLPSAAPSATGRGPLTTKGRELCFSLRNKGPDAPPGERWELINPDPNENSIWKLPLPLIGADGKLDLGRRLIDLNGDGLLDFMAQKKRASALSPGLFSGNPQDLMSYDIEVWINGADSGWIHSPNWRIEGLYIAAGLGGGKEPCGRFIQDINGDGLPDLLVSVDRDHELYDGEIYFYNNAIVRQSAVYFNTGTGFVKDITHSNRVRNFLVAAPPISLSSVTVDYTRTVIESYLQKEILLVDLNGDNSPEMINASKTDATFLSGSTGSKLAGTYFYNSEMGWIQSSSLHSDKDWNLPDDLLAANNYNPAHFADTTGDGAQDILRTLRLEDADVDFQSRGSRTYLRKALYHGPRIARITSGLGVVMEVTYGCLPELAQQVGNPHYRPSQGVATYPHLNALPPATVVTHFTTLDGTEDSGGDGAGAIISTYYYSGLRYHAMKGSLGFEKIETRNSLSPVRQETTYGQNAEDFLGLPLSAVSYIPLPDGGRKVLSTMSTAYGAIDVSPALEAPGKNSRFVFAGSVQERNWSPEGLYLGGTFSENTYFESGEDIGLLHSQTVTLDQGSELDLTDDTSTETEHHYHPGQRDGSAWRFGQIRRTDVWIKSPAGSEDGELHKASTFEYDGSTGQLVEEVVDAGTDHAVTTRHVYDASGNEVKTYSNADGVLPVVSETWYDPSGRFPIATKNPLGHASMAFYDTDRALLTSQTQAFDTGTPPAANNSHGALPSAPQGGGLLSTQYSHDAWGTTKLTTGPDGLRAFRVIQHFRHSSLPQARYYLYEQVEGSPPIITYFDRYHRPLLIEKTGFNGETILQETHYDQQGRPVRTSLPYFAAAAAPAYAVEEFDEYGRKTRVTAPDGTFVTMTYSGFESRVTNHRGQIQLRRVDQKGRLLSTTDHAGHSVSYAYTLDGLPSATTTHYAGAPGASTTITTEYNAQRLKNVVTDPNTGTSNTWYDSYGRVIATRDSNLVFTVFRYDQLGRVVKRWTGVTNFDPTAPAEPESFETRTLTAYDTAPGNGLGKPHTITFIQREGAVEREVTETYGYDFLGRLVHGTTALSNQVAFNGIYSGSTTYHPSTSPGYGRVASVTNPGGFTRVSEYNSLGFLSKVREESGSLLWEGKAYDAQGKLLLEEHGNGLGTVNTYHPTRGFIESSLTWRSSTQTPVQQMDMRVNDMGNVEWRRHIRYDAPPSQQMRSESFTFDTLNRLTGSYVPGQTQQIFTFAANGNIVSKTGVGDYIYGQRGHGPHAVTSITQGAEVLRSYTYDVKGRMTKEHLGASLSVLPLREVSYTSFDQPQRIQHWGAAALSSDPASLGDSETPWDQVCTLNFYFGPSLQRMIHTKVKGQLYTKTLSLGGFEIRETRLGGHDVANLLVEKEERSHFGNGARVKRWTATNLTIPLTVFEYTLNDPLGSDTATYDDGGELQMQRGHLKAGETQKSEHQSYDGWGARRNAETWGPAAGQLYEAQEFPPAEREGSNLARGFTGHEMLDDVGLIHMNGRLYDPVLGRMCAADPYVQEPELVQNYNRYSYVLNNPLSAVDPSGHFFGLIFAGLFALVKALAVTVKVIVSVAALAAVKAAQFVVGVLGFKGTAASLGNIGSSLWAAAKTGVVTLKATLGALGAWSKAHPILAGAVFSGGYNAIQTAVNGGGLTDVLKSTAIGAVTGAVGAAVGVGVLHGMGEAATTFAGKAVHAMAHGVAGGAMSEALGGRFKDGFIGSLIGSGVSHMSGAMFGPVWGRIGVIGRTAVSALSGGTASVLAGGKFADGAYSAAFFHLFNDEMPDSEWLPTVVVTADAPSPGETALSRVSGALSIVSMVPGPIGAIAGVMETGVALFTGDWAGVGWGLVGAAAAVVGAGAAVKGYRAFRAARLAARGATDSAFQRMLNAGGAIDKGALTKAGRALQKHGNRLGSVFPQVTGNPAAINMQGQQVLRDILSSPNQLIKPNRFGGRDIFDVGSGRGVRYDEGGNMMGFLEP
jgi:RHS repeat-associated protein